MAQDRLILSVVIGLCVLDLIRSRPAGVLNLHLVAGSPTDCVEGIVRYLHWEFGVRGGLLTEIAVTTEAAGDECLAVKRILERDGLLVSVVEEPSLMLRM